ncbi:MarR family winged helix-turn-helix transcriptional regulator [Roseibium litorale]|uniref:MarR family transcriptional regulator n=1 Tax=Roseibium litorale TaxID=2803841 RepID=A0ABR9CL83_9HYPH|nr:MarR family transcriptional regulator [Roseibium litorale]MBD8891601.1 MarR family transcriptional regulator [Roseibium litorale]
MDHVDKIIEQWRRERPDLDTRPMALIGRLGRIRAHLSREMEKTFASHGLNAANFDMLATLRRSGPPYRLSPGALMSTTMVTSGTMTNRIDQLEKAGLVERRKNPEDGRSIDIQLTPGGFELIDAALADHCATQKKLVEGLSSEDFNALDAIMTRFLAQFEGTGQD